MVLYNMAQQVDKARIVVKVRKEEGTEDVGRRRKGGESEQRYRFGRESFVSCERSRVFYKWHRRTLLKIFEC